MKVSRSDLLARLLMIQPAVSSRETIQQSSCVILKKGRFHALSQELSASVPSGLDPKLTAAVRADKLIQLLKLLPDDHLEVDYDDHKLVLAGKGKRTRFTCEQEILLPVQEVELPEKYHSLREDFSEAVDLVRRCTLKRAEFLKECVHVCPTHLEASDDSRMLRYTVPAPVAQPVLVRGESLGAIVQLGMTKGAETHNWLHFKNPAGLRLSVRKFLVEAYPDLGQFLHLRGRRVTFPKLLQEASERAGLFENEEQGITIGMKEGQLTVFAECRDGDYKQTMKCKYAGDALRFRVPPKLIRELVKDFSECEITEYAIRVGGSNFVYLAQLEMES